MYHLKIISHNSTHKWHMFLIKGLNVMGLHELTAHTDLKEKVVQIDCGGSVTKDTHQHRNMGIWGVGGEGLMF